MQRHSALLALALALATAACSSSSPPPPTGPTAAELAISGGNTVRLVEVSTGSTVHETNAHLEAFGLAWRPDGQRLAVADCFQNHIVELQAPTWSVSSVALTAASCPFDLNYSPDSASLGATLPYRTDPLGAMLGKFSVAGVNADDVDLGHPLAQLAWRPGGGEVAVATPTGLVILANTAGWPVLHTLTGVQAWSVGYTLEGSRLIVGVSTGFTVLDAAAGYASMSTETGDAVLEVAVDPTGIHVALVTPTAVSLRRAADLVQVQSLAAISSLRKGAFSPDGTTLALSEDMGDVRVVDVPSWTEGTPIPFPSTVRDLAFRPAAVARLPVLFVHGHSGDAAEAWYEDGGSDTSFAASLLANPVLPIDAFFIQLPVHGNGQNTSRSITSDADDILAWIEGGADSSGRQHVGILNLPAYSTLGKVAIVAYSQGSLSSRSYVKNLMGSRLGPAGTVRVSELVTLAAPNHGIGGMLSCGDTNEPDRALRELCAGLSANLSSVLSPCGSCLPSSPPAFGTNLGGETTFLTDLNGHPLVDSCPGGAVYLSETPRSRPSEPGGVLYANFYADDEEDLLVGGHTQGGDCVGRRLARLLSPDAQNREISIPGPFLTVHPRFPHDWDVICPTLRTVFDHQVPNSCTGLVQP